MKIKAGMLLPLAMLALLVHVNGQETDVSSTTFLQKVDYRIYGGLSLSYPIGSTTQQIREIRQDWNEQTDEHSSFSGSFQPRVGFHLGFAMKYSLLSNFSLGTGLQYSQRGYQQKDKYDYQDPAYQYDEQMTNKRTVKINVIEIPFSANYHINEGVDVFAGLTVAFLPRDSSAQITHTVEKKVIANGAYYEPESSPSETQTLQPVPHVNTFNLSYLLGVRFPISPAFKLQLTGQYTGNLFKEQASVHNIQLHTGIAYEF